MKKIVISGGFDPIHPGRIALIENAAKYGEVHIVVNSDAWLIRKKGFFFQQWHDRKKVLEVYTPHIHEVDDSDGTVCEALHRIKPDYFGNGGDRDVKNTPEFDVCLRLGIEALFGLGGGEVFVKLSYKWKTTSDNTAGLVWCDIDMSKLKMKMLRVSAGKKLSLQRHIHRSRFFPMPNGEIRVNLPGVWHVLQAPLEQDLEVLEVQVWDSEEKDIEKISELSDEYEMENDKKIHLNISKSE